MLQTLIISVSLAIVVSAICSICEAVLYTLSASQVEMIKKTSNTGVYLQKFKSDIDEPITAILTLNTIANTIGASVAGAAAANYFGDSNVIWFSLCFTLSILIFSEILPKTLGVSFAYRLGPVITYPIKIMIFFLKPIIWLCRTVTRLLPRGDNDDAISAEEIQTIAALSLKSGDIEENEEKVINNIIELKNKIVRQVMTPRTVTFSLEDQLTVEETMKLVNKLSSHSRIPLYHDDVDEISGIILRKDILLAAAQNKYTIPISALKRSAHFVPETAPLHRVLIDFFERQQHLFIVVDEYGTMTGVISMEDVLEEIVGQEIIDESDSTRDMRELARSRNMISKQNNKL
ncbi:MAG: hemolysin family protein [Desulfotalea sp.]